MTQDSGGGCIVRAVAFDFEAKVERSIELAEMRGVMASGQFVWVDLDLGDADEARALLAELAAAYVGSLPGTAAEILDDEVRAVICP